MCMQAVPLGKAALSTRTLASGRDRWVVDASAWLYSPRDWAGGLSPKYAASPLMNKITVSLEERIRNANGLRSGCIYASCICLACMYLMGAVDRARDYTSK